MDARRWERVNELFQAAIARAHDQRATFLSEACAGDEELGRQVQRLVRAHERSGGFLQRPAVSDALRILASPDGPSAIEPSLTSFRAGAEFRGTDRFAVRRQLGAGGMGVVYEVFDRSRDEMVALKTLRRARASDIFRLKREFRSLADVAHPNLVSLYELIVDGTDCFFTMELVDGVDFVQYVRGSAAADAARQPVQIAHVFRQLVDGIDALHRQGKLHRDIKPSNVLVTPAGRVVILDFGLASDVVHSDSTVGESMVGTPAYLAPERHARAAPSESADWYGVGVTLYEALTGYVPFDGSFDEVGRLKRELDPRSPAEISLNCPADLSAICMGLLRRDPARRLTRREVVQLLEKDSAARVHAPPPEIEIEPAFVGRRQQLATLERALADARQGRATTVYVHGPSGIGKSALVEHFLDRVLRRERLVVLRGRCYERESVPYKALDGVIDSLSQHLRAMPHSQTERLIPLDIAPLLRLFPVMLQVNAAASARGDLREGLDPLVLRQRAFGGLRVLLSRMAERQRVAVYIDDLHWADADSAVLLEELLRPPQAPPILTIACVRLEEVESKPFLQALLGRAATSATTVLTLGPLADDEARGLLMSVIGANAALREAEIHRFVSDAGGNPFLLRQMAGCLATHRVGSAPATLAEILQDRFHALPHGGQQFLEMLAVCGRAMAPEIVHDAVGLAGDERPLVARLRASHFLRASGSAQRVELYHDRIRETLAARISEEQRRSLHGVMARALTARGVDDPEALYEHYREAGDRAQASAHAAIAAAKADATLAFDRAAAYYRAALDLAVDRPAHFDWREKLAAALANAGRPADAADAYLDAARGAQPMRRVELQRLAAEQFLIGGHIDRGLDVIRGVLADVRLPLARSPRAALASLLWRRVKLRWRGLTFVERDARHVPPAQLLRVDTCASVATGLAMVDYVRATDFQTRHLLLALDAGEPGRIARALAADVWFHASRGGRHRRLAIECAARAEAMAAVDGHPAALAFCALTRGASAFMEGDWPAARVHSDRALSILRDQAVATIWEVNSAQVFRTGRTNVSGRVARCCPRVTGTPGRRQNTRELVL